MRTIDVLTRVWVCALVAVARPAAADDQDFDRLAGNYLRELASLQPVSATLLGDHRFDGELDQVSEAQRRRELKFCRRYLGELARISQPLACRGVNAGIDYPGPARLDGCRHQGPQLEVTGTASGRI